MKKIADVWELPLKTLASCEIKVVDSNGKMAFDYFGKTPVSEILEVLNDESIKNKKLIPEGYVVDDTDIVCITGHPWLRIRGWGYLTGVGGLHLPLEEALEKQEALKRWILSKIG